MAGIAGSGGHRPGRKPDPPDLSHTWFWRHTGSFWRRGGCSGGTPRFLPMAVAALSGADSRWWPVNGGGFRGALDVPCRPRDMMCVILA